MYYVFGSWYRGHKIARRGGIFYLGASLGNLTAGLIASGTTSGLSNVKGIAGWRWMYIICTVISLPLGIAGLFLISGHT
jgi:MFS family permease